MTEKEQLVRLTTETMEELLEQFYLGVRLPISVTRTMNPNGILEFTVRYVKQVAEDEE
jgi:hypothetical protein